MEKWGQPSSEVVRLVVQGMQRSGLGVPTVSLVRCLGSLGEERVLCCFIRGGVGPRFRAASFRVLAKMGTACLYRWMWMYRWSRSRLGRGARCTLGLRAQSWERPALIRWMVAG